jgi:mevalonate kinase
VSVCVITATAPGKIILFGEHAVVYGQPAIAVPVSSLRATATVEPGAAGQGLRIVAQDLNRILHIEHLSELVEDSLAYAVRLVLDSLACPIPDAMIRIQ